MFAKIFEQIFDSSISEDYLARHVFMDLLVLANRDGEVDITAEAIARRTNVPIEIVRSSICKLSEPDPQSRTGDAEGRRLVPLDEHRNWGWRIVNYKTYRDIRDEEARKAYFREFKRKQRHPEISAPVHTLSTPVLDSPTLSTYTDADADIDLSWNADASADNPSSPEKLFESGSKGERGPSQDAAIKRVWDYYLEKTGRNPRTYEFTAVRKRKGRARLGECLKKTGGDVDKAAELMKVAIDALAASDWHMGRDAKTNGKAYREWDDHLFGRYETMERWWNV